GGCGGSAQTAAPCKCGHTSSHARAAVAAHHCLCPRRIISRRRALGVASFPLRREGRGAVPILHLLFGIAANGDCSLPMANRTAWPRCRATPSGLGAAPQLRHSVLPEPSRSRPEPALGGHLP